MPKTKTQSLYSGYNSSSNVVDEDHDITWHIWCCASCGSQRWSNATSDSCYLDLCESLKRKPALENKLQLSSHMRRTKLNFSVTAKKFLKFQARVLAGTVQAPHHCVGRGRLYCILDTDALCWHAVERCLWVYVVCASSLPLQFCFVCRNGFARLVARVLRCRYQCWIPAAKLI